LLFFFFLEVEAEVIILEAKVIAEKRIETENIKKNLKRVEDIQILIEFLKQKI
jgi:hypothetical protein